MLKKIIYILIILIAGIQCSDPPNCDISILFPDHTFVENGGWQDIYFIPYSDELASCNELLVLPRNKLIEYSETYATIPIITSPLTGKDFSGLKGSRYYIIVRAKDTKCDLQWERCMDVDLSIDCETTLEIDLKNKSTTESCNGMCLEGKCEQIPCEENEDCLNENTCDGIEYCGSDNICHSGYGLSAGNHCNDDNDITTDQICISGRCVESKCGDGYLDKDMEEECEPPDTEQCGSDCKTINSSDAGNDADSDSDVDTAIDPCESIDCGVNATCNENYECVCNTGFERCGGDIDDGCPINLNTDPNNCTACGNSCGENEICQNGCVCNTGFERCGGNIDDGCPINLNTDPDNCTACGNICGENAVCHSGCVCSPGFNNCDNNWENGCECGTCCYYTSCLTIGNGICCNSDQCGVNATCNENYECVCNTGFERCGGDIDDGCPINLNTDPNNCTACGNSCGENAICQNGCVCNSGYLNCNTTLTDGCECTTCCDGAVCVTVGNGNTGEPCCDTCSNAKHTECSNQECVCKTHYTDCDNNGSCECGGLCNGSVCGCGIDTLLDCNYDGTCECNIVGDSYYCDGTTCCSAGTEDCNNDGTCECNTAAGYYCNGNTTYCCRSGYSDCDGNGSCECPPGSICLGWPTPSCI